MKNKETALRLRTALQNINMKPQELAEKSGVSKSSISQYVNGSHAPSNISSGKMAKILKVNPLWLMGFDVEMLVENKLSDKCDRPYDNVFPIEHKSFPLLGEIACGEPIFANEDRESYIIAGADIKADFCVMAKGDSMINARILDGDIVFIRKDEELIDGQIYAIAIDDEVLLKRVYYDKENDIIQLVSENPAYKPFIYTREQLNHIHVLGKAVAFQSDVL